MTNEVRQAFLNKHNELRSRVARGQERDGAGGNAPMAAKMLKMVYDCDVENSAMRHAQKCMFGHSGKSERSGFAIMVERTEEKGVGQENKLTVSVFNRGVGHYTQ
ncbi:SCP-like protein, partial [Oesophagostomum dentatum]